MFGKVGRRDPQAEPRENNETNTGTSERRKLFDYLLVENPAERWEDCFPGQDTATRYLEIGIVADYSFMTSYGSTTQALKAIEAVIMSANLILHAQVNVQVRLRQLAIVVGELEVEEDSPAKFFEADATGTLGFRCPAETSCVCDVLDENAECADDEKLCGIEQSLAAFTLFSSELYLSNTPSFPDEPTTTLSNNSLESLSHLGHWHLLTSCFDESDGAFGTAWKLLPSESQPRLGTSCMEGLNVGVSSKTSDLWITFIHEVGHSLGLSHSFEEGQRNTGGIMDYGDGTYDGAYQFNKVYRESELCTELTLLASTEFNTCQRSGGVDLFPQVNEACATKAGVSISSSDLYCADGFCPVFSDGTLGTCVPRMAALFFNNTSFRFATTRIGTELSTAEDPKKRQWKVASTDLCDPDQIVEQFTADDLVLVSRGNCSFDEKAVVAFGAGITALVVHDNEESEELLTMLGSASVDLNMVAISLSDGLFLRNAILAGNESDTSGYLGSAPPLLLSQLASKYPSPEKESIFVYIGIGIGVATFLSLVVIIIVILRAKARQRSRMKELALENFHITEEDL